jgi:uncharacterized membrane protein YfcA
MDIPVLHDVLIILHAASATISFFAGGILIFSLGHASAPRWFGLYWWTLVGMVVLLAGAMLVYWAEYSGVERIVFPGLFALGIYMLYRARSASRLLQVRTPSWKHDSIEHIGFTLISLFEGFFIVSGLNLGLPGWLVAILAILGVLVGRWAIGLARRRAGIDQTIAVRK